MDHHKKIISEAGLDKIKNMLLCKINNEQDTLKYYQELIHNLSSEVGREHAENSLALHHKKLELIEEILSYINNVEKDERHGHV